VAGLSRQIVIPFYFPWQVAKNSFFPNDLAVARITKSACFSEGSSRKRPKLTLADRLLDELKATPFEEIQEAGYTSDAKGQRLIGSLEANYVSIDD